jgi:putative FmdB family regulatory protein
MPLYTYKCEKGHTKEAWSSISERESGPACECGLSMQMIITPVRINGAFLGSYANPGYRCPITQQWVDSKKQRLNIMAEHNVREYDGPVRVGPETE